MDIQKVLGVDYGTKRVGLAVSDYTATIAQSLELIEKNSALSASEGDKVVVERIKSIVETQKVSAIVIGFPRHLDGRDGTLAGTIRAFAEQVKTAINVEVVFWDEWLTTSAAEKVLISANVSREKRKQKIDKLAATVLLQNYLDSRKKLGTQR
ncbi:MAG: Holliday junction resolvase RuvX [Elusimicrobiota bacterium]